MKSFFNALIVFSMSISFLYANEKVDSLSIIKIKKLVQKEEDIALAYKEYLLKYGKAPSVVKDLIDNDFLPKGFSVINPFGKEIKIVSEKSKIEEFSSDNLTLTSALSQYYYTDIYRENTKSSQKAKQNISINLNFTENFIYENQTIITNIEVDAKDKTDKGGYYIQNGVLNWFDKDGNYKFTIAKDVLSKELIIDEDNNNYKINIDKNSKSNFYELMYIGKKIYQPNKKNPNELDEFLNLGKKIIKLEKEVEPTVIIIKNSPNGSGVIVNGDIYTWGNNSKKVVSIGNNTYTKDGIQGSGVPIINGMVRARAINYNKDESIKIEDNYLNKENLYSAPSRVKFINMYLDNTKSICAISQNNELYCGGEDILENNFIKFIAYDSTNLYRKNEYLYKSVFFDGKNNLIYDILFVENTYLALARDTNDSSTVSKLYYWGKDNIGGWAGTGKKDETNISTPQILAGYEFSDIFHDYNSNKIIALGKSGNIFIWGGLQSTEPCDKGGKTLCTPTVLGLGQDFTFSSIDQKVNTIIAFANSDEKAYKITINADGTALKSLVEDDIKKSSSFLEEDKSILSFDYNNNGVIWVNSNNKLKGTFTGADELFTKTINQISWEKIKVVSSNNGICGIDTNKQMYCWGDLSNANNDGFVIPIFGSNLQDENTDYMFLEKDGSSITKVTSGDWIANSKYFIKYPTFIGGFNYDVIFK